MKSNLFINGLIYCFNPELIIRFRVVENLIRKSFLTWDLSKIVELSYRMSRLHRLGARQYARQLHHMIYRLLSMASFLLVPRLLTKWVQPNRRRPGMLGVLRHGHQSGEFQLSKISMGCATVWYNYFLSEHTLLF